MLHDTTFGRSTLNRHTGTCCIFQFGVWHRPIGVAVYHVCLGGYGQGW